MAEAICDTSPLQYLHQLGRLDVLRRLVGRVVVPPAVVDELAALSSSNTAEEMARKRRLYTERGAQEVWTVAEDGAVAFYDAAGELGASKLFPDFPRRIELGRS